jgi:hypothetical protein
MSTKQNALKKSLLALVLASQFGYGETSAAPRKEKEPGWSLQDGVLCSRGPSKQACASVSVGSALGSAGVLQAGEEGATLRAGDTLVTLGPGTTVELGTGTNVMGNAGQSRTTMALHIHEGFVHSKPGATPLMVRGARGNVLVAGSAVVSRRGKQMAAVNLGGRLLISGGESWKEIAVGKAKTVLADGSTSEGKARAKAPVVVDSRLIAIDLFQGREPLELRWAAVPAATGYLVRVRRPGEDAPKAVAVGPTQLSAVLPALAPGEYTVTVAALDAMGLPGEESASRGMSVVQVRLPPGALVAPDREIQLNDGQQVEFQFAERAEVAYGMSSFFEPAPQRISMNSGLGRAVRFRHKQGGVEARVSVVERSASAEVVLGPKSARWPADPVQASITLRGLPAGSEGALSVIPRVSLGSVPMEVTWQREGLTWRAVIPPTALTEYQTLRVEVSDQYGFSLGRGFLELAPERR